MCLLIGDVSGTEKKIAADLKAGGRDPESQAILLPLSGHQYVLIQTALPMEVYSMWVQYPWPWGEAACRLRAMMPELVAHVSVLTILAVSGERYVAITNPVYARTTHTLARTARVVPVIWLLSLVAAVPWGYYYQVRPSLHPVIFHSVLSCLSIFCF
ncbi:Neuropeptides capa receptor [Portunus trituberculatus]|uniref:Neuropeptides capa receptor n=1 Tax=Portunus trituberculatus TaxID=210409 RepID=A0A5B7GXT6_PORTR|nr:Neuropeptides capa receptor [Portunus trituberculatus]